MAAECWGAKVKRNKNNQSDQKWQKYILTWSSSCREDGEPWLDDCTTETYSLNPLSNFCNFRTGGSTPHRNTVPKKTIFRILKTTWACSWKVRISRHITWTVCHLKSPLLQKLHFDNHNSVVAWILTANKSVYFSFQQSAMQSTEAYSWIVSSICNLWFTVQNPNFSWLA